MVKVPRVFVVMGLVLTSACSRREADVGVVGVYVGDAGTPSFIASVSQWGWRVREEALLQRPDLAYEAALWIVQVNPVAAVDERAVETLTRYIHDGGRLLCVVCGAPAVAPDKASLDGWWINKLGAQLGFKVLATTTRKPRNVAPEILGNWNEIDRTTWAAYEVRLTGTGSVLVADDDLRPMAVMCEAGRGQVAVVGHPDLLNENPDLARNLILHLAGAER